jgi:heme/copper-type cytochrome/quinol oxidase subunit 2
MIKILNIDISKLLTFTTIAFLFFVVIAFGLIGLYNFLETKTNHKNSRLIKWTWIFIVSLICTGLSIFCLFFLGDFDTQTV